MKIHRPSKRHLRKFKDSAPINHLLGKELIIDNDNDKKILDLTAIVYDPEEERKYPGNDGAYGINFVFTREDMSRLSKLVEEWKIHNNKFTLKRKIEGLEKLIGLYQEKLDQKNELLNNYRKAIESIGMSLPEFWSGKLNEKINELIALKKMRPPVIKAEPLSSKEPPPEINPTTKKPFRKDMHYKKPHQVWGSRDYNPPV